MGSLYKVSKIWLALKVLLLLTGLFAASTHVANLRDWGDSSYEAQPLMQIHDKLIVSFEVGAFSGIYILAVGIATFMFSGRGRGLALVAVVIALLIATETDRPILASLSSIADYVQLAPSR